MGIRVDVFPTLDDAGKALVAAIHRELTAALPDIDIRTVTSREPFAIPRSMVRADVTILDLTPAPDGVHRYTAMNYPWQRDHVLASWRSPGATFRSTWPPPTAVAPPSTREVGGTTRSRPGSGTRCAGGWPAAVERS